MGDDAFNLAAWMLEGGRSDDVAATWKGGECSYNELRTRVRRVAARVRGVVDMGAIVPIVGQSSIDWIASYLGVLYAGAVPALVPPTTADNLRGIFDEVGARLAFVDASVDSASGLSTTLCALGDQADHEVEPVMRPASELTAVLYTSGSTGRSKGVMVSGSNFIANAQWILEACPLTRSDRAFSTLPFFYCYGLSVLHCHLRVGASLHLCQATLPEDIVVELADSGATGLPSVPSLFYVLTTRSSFAKRAPRSLRYLMVSGGRLSDAAVRTLRDTMPATTLYVRYGVTELTAAASFLPPEQLATKLGSIGPTRPGEITVEREDGQTVTPGTEEVGELVVRGPSVAQGYFADPALSRERFRDGRFHTGDLARVDSDGFIYLIGRTTDFVKSMGHRVSPAEIEEVLSRAPGVRESGVCGIPHPLRGEAIAAAVVLAEGAEATPASLIQYCARELPVFKVPFKILVVSELPRTPSAKLDRPRLATLLVGA